MAKPRSKRIWKLYNESLVQRGNDAVWFDTELLTLWSKPARREGRGRPQMFCDSLIETLLTVREVFHLTFRSVEGFAQSIFCMLKINTFPVPDYTSLCKRSKKLDVKIKTYRRSQPTVILLDSTGLKVFGEGEWKVRMHGISKRRTWRKIHIARGNDGQIHACLVTDNSVDDASAALKLLDSFKGNFQTVIADGAYDKRKVYNYASKRGVEPIIPPRKDGRFDTSKLFGSCSYLRDEALFYMRCGWLNAWKKKYGYHRRSLVETEMYRLKQITGNRLKSRLPETQATETMIRINVLNKFAAMSGIFR